MAKTMLLDGNSLIFRAFFAIPDDMATKSGVVTNAVYGFTSMLVNLLRDHHPDAVGVAFDRPEPTFRHEIVEDYKAGRAETPDILWPQFDLVKDLLGALGIQGVELAGYEADDIIATLAARADARGDDVIVVTGDRDCFQLVTDPHVRVLYNKRGVSDYVLYDEAGIVERTGVRPDQYVAYAAMRGDPSDNLPGIPGVGEKTAARLINDYGDLDGIFEHLDELTPKLRENLRSHEHLARSNLVMMPLIRDLDIDLGVDDSELTVGRWDAGELTRVCTSLEFGALRRRLTEVLSGYAARPDGGSDALPSGIPAGETRAGVHGDRDQGGAEVGAVQGGGPGPGTPEPVIARSAADVKRWFSIPPGDGEAPDLASTGLALSWDGDPGRSGIAGVMFVRGGGQETAEAALWVSGSVLESEAVRRAVDSGLRTPGIAIAGHRVKEMMRSLLPLGVDIGGRRSVLSCDTAVAAYLLDPGEGQYHLDTLGERYLGRSLGVEGVGVREGQLDLDAAEPDAGDRSSMERAFRCASGALALAPVLRRELDDAGMLELFLTVEIPLIRVLARMEVVGIAVDARRLEKLSSSLTKEAAGLDEEIQQLAGERFKVNSTPQLRVVLYDKLGLAPSKKTKTGYSTDAASLEKLRDQHPIIEKLLRYREVEKLRSTYGTGLIGEIGSDGRIHASFNQTVARTGRLSSDRPNLHNIPVRTEDGRRFREAFIPAPGWLFLIADYNQIELRVIAHLSGDTGLADAFRSGRDIHSTTAARIFDVPEEKVTVAQRSKAKMVSYGLAYGMESFVLASRLGVPVDEAAKILAAFFESFPGVKSYMDGTVADARRRGYTVTELGRRRPVPELHSAHYTVRQQGERQAMNSGIQGLAADLFKMALVRIQGMLEKEKMETRIVLQVHDEVVLEMPPEETDKAREVTRSAMVEAHPLDVPLEVDISVGSSWAAAK